MPGCELIQPVIITGGKIDLQPEESEQMSLGLVYAPNSRFNASLDWWEIERTNTIRSPSLDTLIDNYELFSKN